MSAAFEVLSPRSSDSTGLKQRRTATSHMLKLANFMDNFFRERNPRMYQASFLRSSSLSLS